MLGYSEQERVNEVVNRPFTYTFTPATAVLDAVVRVDFEDGQHYGGIAIPKGHFQISLKDVFFIQLYEVDANGEVLYDINGNIKSTLQMWMEQVLITWSSNPTKNAPCIKHRALFFFVGR